MARAGRFICQECEKIGATRPFVSQSALEMHMRSKHPRNAPPRPQPQLRTHVPDGIGWMPDAPVIKHRPSVLGSTLRWAVLLALLGVAGAIGAPFLSAYLQADPTATHE